jgi:prepilin-type N-terminal cleavage/methylation domain-containing protein
MRTQRQNAEGALRAGRLRRALSLMEVLLAVAVLSILAATIVPLFEPSLIDELENAAVVVVSDLEYGRSLAAANNSKYRFDLSRADSYYLEHSGTTASLKALPPSAFRQSSDPIDRQTTAFSRLPGLRNVRLFGACAVNGSSRAKITQVEFNALGATTRALPSEVWLTAGHGTSQRFIAIVVNPLTGLARVAEITGQAPDFPPNS